MFLLATVNVEPGLAQVEIPSTDLASFVLSKHEDFSTNDRIFEGEDVVHMKIVAPDIDFTGLAVNEFSLESDDVNESVKGDFENLFDGTYVTRFDLSESNVTAIRWEWHALLEDDKGNQFEAEAEFFVGDPNADGIEIEISGLIEEIGDAFFIFYGRKVIVTDKTEIISENGDVLRLADLDAGDEINVLILITGESEDLTLTALHIIQEEDNRTEEVEVKGLITEIGDRVFVVQNLVFSISDDTKILGANEEELAFADLEENWEVSVIGQYQDDGALVAILIIVEDDDRGEFSITGNILVIEDDAIIVQETLFLLTDNTVILSESGEVVRLDYLQVGQFVEVRAQLGSNGLPVAITIKVLDNAIGIVYATGVIEQIFDAGLVVQGRKFLVTNNTGIVDENGHPISFSGLTEGTEVSVIGQYINETEMEAILITLNDGTSDAVQVEGVITGLEDDGLVVQDLFFALTDATLIIGGDGQLLGIADLKAGLYVTVVGKRSDEGMLYATQVTVEPRKIVIDGHIDRIDGDVFYVADFKFLINDHTEIIGENGEAIRFESLHVGALVLVEAEAISVTDVNEIGSVINDEVYLATKIILLDDVREKISVTGLIHELGEERLIVGDYSFLLTAETVVKDEQGALIDMGRLHAGLLVEVEAVVNADGVLVAVCIQVKVDRPIKISGKIEAIEGETIVVGGVRFTVTGDTEIISVLGGLLGLQDLQVGMLARVSLVSLASGQLVATHMKVLPRIEDEVEVTGVLEAVNERSVVILGRTFHVSPNTLILDEQDQVMDLGGLSIGRTVSVRADLLPGDGLVALKIKQLEAQVKEIQVTGPIEAIESNTVAVIGIYFFVDTNTEVFNLDGEAIRLENLEVGKTVALFATGQPDGTRLADSIREQDVVVVSGDIESLSDAALTMLGASFTFDANALVLGAINDHLQRTDLKAGQYVEIRGITGNTAGKNSAPSIVTKIKVLNLSIASVGVEDQEVKTLPDGFSLHQNYPNPFNPSTNISFALQEAGFVSLSIYTLLGQEIMQLASGDFTPGMHQVQWTGRDHAGNLVASGVYLYRLQVGNEVQTRQMIFLK